MTQRPELIAFEDSELNRFVQQEEEAFSALQWSQETLPLTKFIRKFTLPQMVRVEDGYYSQEEDSSLSSGQILKIHCLKTSKKVLGIDQHGDSVHIPLNASEKVLLRPENWSKSYETVNDLNQAKTLPKYVEVTRGYYDPSGSSAEHDQTVEPGERLEVLGELDPHNFLRPAKLRFMKFRKRNGIELKLPFDSAPHFISLLDSKQYLVAEAVHAAKLPINVSFAALSGTAAYTKKDTQDKNLARFGVVTLKEIYEEELIVASCGHRSVRVIFTIPNCIDVTVKVAVGTLINDPTYAGLCQEYNNYKKIETLAIQRHERDIYRNSGEVRGYEYYLKSIEGGEFQGMEETSEYMEMEDSESEDEYVYSEECLRSPAADSMKSRRTLPYEVTNIHVNDFKKGGKYSKHITAQAEKVFGKKESYDFDPDIKEVSNSAKEPLQLLGVKKNKENYSAKVVDKTTEEIDTETKELQDGNEYLIAVNWNNNTAEKPKALPELKIPPRSPKPSQIKPGPLSIPNTVPVTAPQSPSAFPSKCVPLIAPKPVALTSAAKTAESKIDYDIPANLENLTTEDICKCLAKLHLGHLAQIFRDNQINGALFLSLELEDYKDLSLTNFQAKKIIKFAGGWRPDS